MNLKRAKKLRKAVRLMNLPWVIYEVDRGKRVLYQCGRELYQRIKYEDKKEPLIWLNQNNEYLEENTNV